MLKRVTFPGSIATSTIVARAVTAAALLAVALPGLAQTPAPAAATTNETPAAQPMLPTAPLPVATTPTAALPAATTPTVAATPADDKTATPTVTESAKKDETAKKEKKFFPWSGAVSFRNLTSTTLFDPSYEQTYLPSETLGVLITPRYKLNDTMSIGLWQYSTVELTNTANTKYYREPTLSDTSVSFSWTALNTVPKPPKDAGDDYHPTGFSLSLQGIWTLPTSKASIAKQLYSGLAVGVGARYMWKGLTVGLTGRVQKHFYKTTTMEYDAFPITTCTGGAEGCNPSLLSSGVRSSEWRVLAIGSASYSITEKFGVSLSAGEIMDWLPALTAAQIPAIGAHGAMLPVGDDQNFRALMYWGAGLDYSILPWLGAGLGIETYNSQLKADSTYETPFINRYTTAYLELSLALDGLPH